MKKTDSMFWQVLMEPAVTGSIVLDWPQGTAQPLYPDMIYPLDKGYIENTSAADGSGIDVWIGSKDRKTLTGILCTFDRLKREAEIKLLIGCTLEDVEIIQQFTHEMEPSFSPIRWWTMTFPSEFNDLLYGDKKPLLYLATTMRDGSPQVTPVWFETHGDYILINTNEGRVKDRNMKERSRVSMVIQDPDEQERYLGIRGEVVGFTREGADEHINRLSLKYKNKPWVYREGQRRIIYRIKPIHFDLHNS